MDPPKLNTPILATEYNMIKKIIRRNPNSLAGGPYIKQNKEQRRK